MTTPTDYRDPVSVLYAQLRDLDRLRADLESGWLLRYATDAAPLTQQPTPATITP